MSSKDYTISHPCGLEQLCSSFDEARAEAEKHKKECFGVSGLDLGFVAIDEYDKDAGELTGKYWKV